MHEVFVLFSIKHHRFDPALVGVFTDHKVAAEAERKFHFSHPDHMTSFILKLPVCHSVEDYEKQFKATIVNSMIKKIRGYNV